MILLRNILYLFQQLFDKNVKRLTSKTKLLLNIIYLIIALNIWSSLIIAKYEIYDKNLGSMLGAFLFSLLTFVVFFILFFKRRHWLKDNSFGTILFFITCSPLTVAIIVLNYVAIFGQIDNG